MTVYFISNELHIYSVTFFLLIKSKTLNKSLLKISSHNSSLYSLLNSFCYFFITPTLKNSSGTSIYYYKEKMPLDIIQEKMPLPSMGENAVNGIL